MGLLKLANRSFFGWGEGLEAGGDVGGGLKFKVPNVSSNPPSEDCCWLGGDCKPPKDGCRPCDAGGGGFGAEAYNERMDCFKSGLEGTAGLAGLEDELEGLADEPDGGPPKKSRPSNESDALVGLGGAEALRGGGLAPVVSVVFGLTGGSGTSPKRSTWGVAFGGGGTRWLEVEEARCEVLCSNLAFCCTMFRG